MSGILVCGELRLRRLRGDDARPLYQAVRASLDSLVHWLPWCHLGYAEVDAVAWIAHCQRAWQTRSEFPLGVFGADGALLGGVGLSRVDRAQRQANLGYWVTASGRARGVATAAARRMAQFGFAELDLARIEIVVHPDNHASQRVAEKLGATREALARNRIVLHGEPADAFVYSLIPGDLAPLD